MILVSIPTTAYERASLAMVYSQTTKGRLIRIRLLGAFLFVLSVSVFSQGLAQNNYRTYHNARFDYSISYPANILVPQGEAENGDGQKFLSGNGRAEMLVYGSHNSLDQSLRQVYESETSRTEHPNRRVTYRAKVSFDLSLASRATLRHVSFPPLFN
jgi:hypothetical protein